MAVRKGPLSKPSARLKKERKEQQSCLQPDKITRQMTKRKKK